jgi:uncharacterized protein (TIGR02145 family)
MLSSSVFQRASCQTGQDVYKVQVASSLTKMDVQQVQKNLKLTDAVTEHFISGRYKYFVGNFPSLKEAQKYLVNVPVQGAYVVKITSETSGTTPAPTSKTSTLVEKKTDQPKTKSEPVAKIIPTQAKAETGKVFALQISASKDFIDPKTFKEKFSLNEEVNCIKKDGWYKYVIGRFNSEGEASARLSKLDIPAFIISYDAPVADTKSAQVKTEVSTITKPESKKQEEVAKAKPEEVIHKEPAREIDPKPVEPRSKPGEIVILNGKPYASRTIGTQTWMVANLAYLPSVNPSFKSSFDSPHYYVYGYEGTDTTAAKGTTNYATYGTLYNWEAAIKACPYGWHLPTYEEWNVMIEYLGTNAGGKLKESGSAHWTSSNLGATNETQFSALPGGFLQGYGSGFFFLGDCAHFWTASADNYEQAKSISLYRDASNVWRDNPAIGKANGLSVRCLRD